MILKDFETVFHLSVIFNFFYAALDNFSDRIYLFFPVPFQAFSVKLLNEFSRKVLVIKSSKIFTDPKINAASLNDITERKFSEINVLLSDFLKGDKNDFEFSLKFKSLYLISGFYSFFLLVISGFGDYFDNTKTYHSIFFIDCLLAIFFLYVFISTFHKKIRKVKPAATLIFFIIIIIAFKFLYATNETIRCDKIIPSNNCTISFGVTIVLLPFFLHFLRAFLQICFVWFYILYLRIKYRLIFSYIRGEAKRVKNAFDTVKQYELKQPTDKKI
jgi:hypothetical protein